MDDGTGRTKWIICGITRRIGKDKLGGAFESFRKMIELVTVKDMEWFTTQLQTLSERTKRQTEQIKELQNKIKELEKWKKQ